MKSNQIKSNRIESNRIELNWIEKCSKWKRQGLNFAQFYPELFCVLHLCSMLLTTAMPVDFFSAMKINSMQINWNGMLMKLEEIAWDFEFSP